MLHQTTDTLYSYPIASIVVAAIVLMALTAVANFILAQRAERLNPPKGRVISAQGVRLHYLEQGRSGPALVLLHGNGSMIEDFVSSGLIEGAARKYRVIAFDRPGFGHSDRPRNKVWTPENQAQAIRAALAEIGISEFLVLGHSWGTFVALALAMRYPQSVKALILVSGYYFPTARADVVLFSAPAIPIVGDILRYTVSPIVSRLIWPLLLDKIFGPAPVPTKFKQLFPKEMAVRPSQLRASAADSALMIPAATTLQKDYRGLPMPVVIAAGAEDKFVESDESARLHSDIPGSTLRIIPRNGHMVHQTATIEIMEAIDTAASFLGRTRDTAAA
jgi:pimeloyl-ACP methyl ester carboxylesterase